MEPRPMQGQRYAAAAAIYPGRTEPADGVAAIQKISNGLLVSYEIPRMVTIPKNWQPPGTFPIPSSFNPIITQLLRRQLEKLEEGEGWKGEESIGSLMDKLDVEMKAMFEKPRTVSLAYYVVESVTVFCGPGGADLAATIKLATEQHDLIEKYRTEGKLIQYGQPDQVTLLSSDDATRYAAAR